MDIPKPKRGGARPGSGRPKGKPDRATVEQKATLEQLARTYTEAALATLHRVCTKSESDSAAVTAASAILDRGYGKPRQGVELTGDSENPVHHKIESDAGFVTLVSALEGFTAGPARGDNSAGEVAETVTPEPENAKG